jgi:hypothetical protein
MAEEKTVEEKAKQMGHIPKEDWKGDPDKWRPASEYVDRGENIIPILKKRIDDMESDFKIALKANKREVEEAKEAAYNLATSQYKEKLEALDKKELEAFSDGDSEAFQKVKKAKEALKAPEAPVKVVDTPSKNPEFEDWKAKEKWYESDPELQKEADIQGFAIAQKNPGKPLSEIYEMTARNVKKLHPDKFKNPNREGSPSVEEGTNGQPINGNNTFASLPSSAKAQYTRLAEKFKAKGRTYTKEQYAKDWHE